MPQPHDRQLGHQRQEQQIGNSFKSTRMIFLILSSGKTGSQYQIHSKDRHKEMKEIIAFFPDRIFQIWEYQVTHASMLIRSPKRKDDLENIDLIFSGVDYLNTSSIFRGLRVSRVDKERLSAIDNVPSRAFSTSSELYLLETENSHHFISAVWCRLDQNTESMWYSPFQSLHPSRSTVSQNDDIPPLPHPAPWAKDKGRTNR